MRRTRFTVTFENGPTRQVLAYSAQQAVEHYSRRGLRVASIARIDRATGTAVPGLRVDQAALAEAIDFLGLKLPVYVRWTTGRRTTGTHSLRFGWQAPRSARVPEGGLYHHVTLSAARGAEHASRTAWHELAHAAQAERAMDAAPPNASLFECRRLWTEADERDRKHRYRNRPCEVEARSYEAFADELPLVVNTTNRA